ncbi:hypothetical protein MMC30_006951 [Trapelia coarctata]|nr:hypothetical protein [Trapelia coarctata]
MTSHGTYLLYEILFRVVELQDSRQALSNLRLVNKPISKVATKLLFHTLTTWLVDYQAEKLENIAKNKELRRHVREIVFMPWRVNNTYGIDDYLRLIWDSDIRTQTEDAPPNLTMENFNDHVQKVVLNSGTVIKENHPDAKICFAHAEYPSSFLKLGYDRHREAHDDLMERMPDGSKSMDLAFTLVRFANLSTVRIVGYRRQTSQFFLDTGVEPRSFQWSEGQLIFKAVVKALAKADPDLESFQVEPEAFGMSLDERAICDTFINAAQDQDYSFLNAFRNLRFLTLRGVNAGYPPRARYTCLPSLRAIARLTEACPKLENLKVGLSEQNQLAQPLSCLLPNRALTNLGTLQLDFLVVEEDELIGMLDIQKGNLKSLDLICVCLRGGSWLSAVDKIHGGLSLKAANTFFLHEDPDRKPEIHWRGQYKRVRMCFREHPNLDLVGCADDYMCHRIDFNPLRRAVDSGCSESEGARFWRYRDDEGAPTGYQCHCPRRTA